MTPPVPPGLELAHAVLYVHDLDVIVDFYCDVLGFEVTDRGPIRTFEVAFLSQAVTHHQIAFMTGRTSPSPSHTLNHVAFRSTGSLDDLRVLHGRLRQRSDVSDVRTLTHGNTWSVYFLDPEHNGVEIYVSTPWHVAQPQGEDIDLSEPDESIIARTRALFEGEPTFEDQSAFRRRRAERLGLG